MEEREAWHFDIVLYLFACLFFLWKVSPLRIGAIFSSLHCYCLTPRMLNRECPYNK